MLQCAFIGVLDAVTGLRAFVFVTVADFTCTSLVQHQVAGYVIVETEEVRIQRQTKQIIEINYVYDYVFKHIQRGNIFQFEFIKTS